MIFNQGLFQQVSKRRSQSQLAALLLNFWTQFYFLFMLVTFQVIIGLCVLIFLVCMDSYGRSGLKLESLSWRLAFTLMFSFPIIVFIVYIKLFLISKICRQGNIAICIRGNFVYNIMVGGLIINHYDNGFIIIQILHQIFMYSNEVKLAAG